MKNCNTGNMNNCVSEKKKHFGDCCCHGAESGFNRRFVSKSEIKEKLERYKEELNKELTAVDEQIKQLSSK